MKRFRISFLAIIAVVAIGLTAASKAELAKPAKVSGAAEPCLQTDATAYAAIRFVNSGNAYYNNPLVPPPPAPAFDDCPSDETGCVLLLTRVPQDITCDLTPNFFCCAKVVADCATPGQKEVQIFCKAAIE